MALLKVGEQRIVWGEGMQRNLGGLFWVEVVKNVGGSGGGLPT